MPVGGPDLHPVHVGRRAAGRAPAGRSGRWRRRRRRPVPGASRARRPSARAARWCSGVGHRLVGGGPLGELGGADDDDHERQQPRRQEQHDGVAQATDGMGHGPPRSCGRIRRRGPRRQRQNFTAPRQVSPDAGCGPGTRACRRPEVHHGRAHLEGAAGRPRGLRARAVTEPLCSSRHRQVWPLRLLSISPSTSMRPSSGLALSFQSALALQRAPADDVVVVGHGGRGAGIGSERGEQGDGEDAGGGVHGELLGCGGR